MRCKARCFDFSRATARCWWTRTEPVLRVYAEGRSQAMMKDLLDYGREVAEQVV